MLHLQNLCAPLAVMLQLYRDTLFECVCWVPEYVMSCTSAASLSKCELSTTGLARMLWASAHHTYEHIMCTCASCSSCESASCSQQQLLCLCCGAGSAGGAWRLWCCCKPYQWYCSAVQVGKAAVAVWWMVPCNATMF